MTQPVDPISGLQGKVEEPLPEVTPQPQQPQPQEPTISGTTPIIAPQVTPQPVPNTGIAPAQVLQESIGQQVTREVQKGRKQQAIGAAEANALTQERYMPYVYSPPDPQQLVNEFGTSLDYALNNLREQNRRQQTQLGTDGLTVEQRQAFVNQMQQYLQSPEGRQGSTASAFWWVQDLIGKQDGGRRYLQPYNQERGFSLPATLLYSLGVVQNTVIGGVLDARQLIAGAHNMLPNWARLDGGDTRKQQHMPWMAQWLIGSNTTGDGKSNTIEALRGAQFSFSDTGGDNVGIKNNFAVRANRNWIPAVSPAAAAAVALTDRLGVTKSERWGVVVNPTALVGFGLDVFTGAKADKIVDVGRLMFAPVRGVYRAIKPKPQAVEQGAKTVGEHFVQGELPFVPGTPRVVKTKPQPEVGSNAQLLQVFGGKQARVDAFNQANDIARLQQVQAVSKRIDAQQLSLFDTLPEVRVTAPKPLKPPKSTAVVQVPATMQQEDIVRATKAMLDADPTGDIQVQASIVGDMLATAKRSKRTAQEALEATADVGRKFVGDVEPLPIVPLAREMKLPTVSVPEQVYHGTRVAGLSLPDADPLLGAARSELGTGHYLTTDPDYAKTAAMAMSAVNLPGLPGRVIAEPQLIEAAIDSGAKLIDATAPATDLMQLVREVAEQFPQLRGYLDGVSAVSLAQVYDDIAKQLPEAEALQFQRAVAQTLRESGYDGVAMGGTVAMYNPKAIAQRSTTALADSESVIPKLAARADLEAGAPPTEFSKAATADADLKLASQTEFEMQQLADDMVGKINEFNDALKLWDDTVELPTQSAQTLPASTITPETLKELKRKAYTELNELAREASENFDPLLLRRVEAKQAEIDNLLKKSPCEM